MSSFNELVTILAQTAAPATPQGGIPSYMVFGYVLLFGAMYFFMIAPQRKKQKELAKAIAELKSGDEVLIAGGIFGEISMKKDDRFVVRIADNTKIEVRKDAVQAILGKPAEKK
jgi:preprotein translocase subunit YajC